MREAVLDPATAHHPDKPPIWPEAVYNQAFVYQRGDEAGTKTAFTQARHHVEMTARLKIGAAKTKDELLGLVNRVQLKFDSGELPKAAVERLLKLADERRRAIPGD